jgi:ATP-dependent Lon protease
VSHMPGRGKLILTGSLRDVMKEAAQVVVSYIQTHARDLGIDEKTATQLADGKLDIHIHYPDTATPKDGPSAGISTFLALYSSLSGKPVPQNIGLTGEIGLHGEVMPIGGLKEKISGAFAQGVTEFIVPVSNMDQVEDAMRKSKAFANIYSQVRIHYVSTVQDILNVVNQLSNPPKEAPSVAAPQVETPPVPDKTPPEKAAQEPTTPKDPPEPAFSGSRGATQWGIA